ncbi:jg19857 [Pararge aegeria aegeria]|uniref:Jg19857 protein n=1 Tax=Pararge aegeria aegeria TaxID=348720 RepID=A0A8S4R083_9NEOP|nr:jg19857 [Pararge aegeria aegeria]
MDVEFIRHNFEDSYNGVLTKTKFKLGVRHLQMVYMFVCSLVLGMLRGSNGVGVLAIADYTRKNDTYVPIHNWDMRIQGTVLSSFLFGYALILVPAELYLKQMADKLILTAVLLINGGLAAAMPTIVNKGGWIAVCNAQFLMGMTQACLTPVNQKLISNWLPPGEREVFGFIIQGAILIGTIISLPISGLLTESRLSWELIFYSQAMMTLSMAVIWSLLTGSSPERHQAMGDTEKEFIRETLAGYHQSCRDLNLQSRPQRDQLSYGNPTVDAKIRTFGIIIGLTILPNLVSNWNHLGVIVLIGTLGLVGLQFSGFLENHKDMTQNYQGTLLLMSSVVASTLGALVPLVSGLVIGDDVFNLNRWRIMFMSLAGFYIGCNIVYSAFASSERQEWDGTLKQKFGYSNDVTNMELEELSQPKVNNRCLEEDTVV